MCPFPLFNKLFIYSTISRISLLTPSLPQPWSRHCPWQSSHWPPCVHLTAYSLFSTHSQKDPVKIYNQSRHSWARTFQVPLPLTSTPAILAHFMFLKHPSHIPTSGHLHLSLCLEYCSPEYPQGTFLHLPEGSAQVSSLREAFATLLFKDASSPHQHFQPLAPHLRTHHLMCPSFILVSDP